MWNDLLRTIHARAIEESDQQPPLWPQDVRRTATQQARNAFPNTPLTRFLIERARLLFENRQGQDESTPPLPAMPAIPVWVSGLGWLVAIALGATLTAFGQESEINLLALPLIGLLLWNAVVLLISLFSKGHMPWLQSLSEFLFKRLPGATHAQAQRFYQLARPAWTLRLAYRFRAWLHIAAALLALGSISGMYARGWSKEYRAVWESTLLDESAARSFFNTLFLPASSLLGLPVPTADLSSMRRGIHHPAEKSAPAKPWIHLYGATLALFILLPRGCFALLEWQRSRQAAAQSLQTDDWRQYATRLLALTEGSGAPVQILVHGLPVDNDAKDRWRLLAHQQWPDMGACHYAPIPAGSEAEFVNTWTPTTETAYLLAFNLASVPEVEIHRWLAQALVDKWNSIKPHPSLLVILDESFLHKRWSGFADYPQRLAQRRDNWVKLFAGLPVEVK